MDSQHLYWSRKVRNPSESIGKTDFPQHYFANLTYVKEWQKMMV